MEEAVPGSSIPRQSHEAHESAWPCVSQQQELARLLVVPTLSHLPNAAVLMRVPALPPHHQVPRSKQACWGRAGSTQQRVLPMEVESILGLPKKQPVLWKHRV